jgi:integrase
VYKERYKFSKIGAVFMVLGKLNNRKIANLLKQNIIGLVNDGDGLYLNISSAGHCSWVLRYTSSTLKKKRNMGLGSYPSVSILEARNLKNKAKYLNYTGTDPIDARKFNAHNINVDEIYKKWVIQKTAQAESFTKIKGIFEKYLICRIADMKIADITALHISEILVSLQNDKGISVTAHKLCRYFNQMMNYAVNLGFISFNPCQKVACCLNSAVTRHLPSIKYTEFDQLFRNLAKAKFRGTSVFLFIFNILTIVRPKEASSARWSEVDLKKKYGLFRQKG